MHRAWSDGKAFRSGGSYASTGSPRFNNCQTQLGTPKELAAPCCRISPQVPRGSGPWRSEQFGETATGRLHHPDGSVTDLSDPCPQWAPEVHVVRGHDSAILWHIRGNGKQHDSISNPWRWWVLVKTILNLFVSLWKCAVNSLSSVLKYPTEPRITFTRSA